MRELLYNQPLPLLLPALDNSLTQSVDLFFFWYNLHQKSSYNNEKPHFVGKSDASKKIETSAVVNFRCKLSFQ